jgi:hypothetical protein
LGVSRRHSDPLEQFSYRLTQIKFILFEIVIFIGFLMFLWDKVKYDVPFTPRISSASRDFSACSFGLFPGRASQAANTDPQIECVVSGDFTLMSIVMLCVKSRSIENIFRQGHGLLDSNSRSRLARGGLNGLLHSAGGRNARAF